MNNKLVAGVATLLALGTAGMAKADLITNGDFSSSTYTTSNQFGTGYGGQGVTGWTGNGGYGLYFQSNPTTVSANSQYDNGAGTGAEFLYGNASQFTGHGAFVALDGDPTVGGGDSISQTINGLVAGQLYSLSFDWGADQLRSRNGATTEQLQVSLGSQTLLTPVMSNAAASFTGWTTSTLMFTATSTSEVLTFLSLGTPTGLPPIAVLDNVSLQVPEPSSIGLLGAGLAFLGFTAARRRRNAL